MSFSRRSLFVKRCSSSIPSGKQEGMAKDYCEIRSEDGFFEAPESSRIIPHEEKMKNVRHREPVKDSRRTHARGLLIENAKSSTEDDEADNAIQKMLSENQSNDESYFTNTADGRRSRQGFTANNSSSNETALPKDVRSAVDKINSFMPFSNDSTPRPKRGISRKKYSANNLTPKKVILHDGISRAVSQQRRSLSASHGSIPRPKKNNFFGNCDSGDCLLMGEDNYFVLGDNVPPTESRTSMSNVGCSAKPRPKKRDSTRKPNFTDDIMLSTDIDQILEKELSEFDLGAKMSYVTREGPTPRRDLNQKPYLEEDSQLEQDIAYILSDDELSGSALRPKKMTSKRRINYEDNIKTGNNMDTIMEEEVEEVDLRATVRASKSCTMPCSQGKLFRQARHDGSVLATSGIADQKKRPINNQTRPRDFILDAVIDEIMEIPVFESNMSPKDKIEKVLSSGVAKHKYRPSSVAIANKPANEKKAVMADSRVGDYKEPADYSIEELVAELFPDLLDDVLPLDGPDHELPDDSIQTLNRDSACSVTDGDALRPMAAGLSQVGSARPYSRSSRTSAEKWSTGVVYTDDELRLMAQIERKYTVRERRGEDLPQLPRCKRFSS